MINVALLVYNLILIAGTTYVIIVHNWSMWTFLLTILMMVYTKDKQ